MKLIESRQRLAWGLYLALLSTPMLRGEQNTEQDANRILQKAIAMETVFAEALNGRQSVKVQEDGIPTGGRLELVDAVSLSPEGNWVRKPVSVGV